MPIIQDIGYYGPVAYTSGLTPDNAAFTVVYNGVTYSANPNSIPFTTGVTFNASDWLAIPTFIPNIMDRTSAQNTSVPSTIKLIIVDGLFYKRDANGTALTTLDGGNWSPQGQTYITHWGAVPEDQSSAQKYANAAAIKAALAYAQHVIVPPDGRFFATLDTPILINSGQTFMGVGLPGAAANGLDDGGSKLVLDGTATSAFESSNPNLALIQASISHLAIQFNGSFSYMMDLVNLIGCNFAFLDLEAPSSLTMNGLRANKTLSVSWRNDFNTVRIRLPNGSSGRPWDVGFGDSDIYGLILGGGVGSFDRSTGNNNYLGGLWNNSSVAAMTFTGQQGIGTNGLMTGVVVEENTGVDIIIDADNNTDNSDVCFYRILGCTFRSNVTAIKMINTTGVVRRGVLISSCTFAGSVVKAIEYDATKWDNIRITSNVFRHVDMNQLSLGKNSESNLTIASGAITVNGSRARIGTELAAASDNLDTINGGIDGSLLVLQTVVDTSRVVICKDGTGNLQLNGDCALTNRKDKLLLMYDSETAQWHEISRSIN